MRLADVDLEIILPLNEVDFKWLLVNAILRRNLQIACRLAHSLFMRFVTLTLVCTF